MYSEWSKNQKVAVSYNVFLKVSFVLFDTEQNKKTGELLTELSRGIYWKH